MVTEKKYKILHLLAQPGFRPNIFWKPRKTLIDPKPARELLLRGGIPKFKSIWDPFKSTTSGFIKYQPPKKPLPPKKEIENPQLWHEIKSRFQFNIQGSFADEGNTFLKHFSKTCKALFVVGWVKCRSNYVIGHVQGDTLALSHLKKWLHDGCSEGGKIQTIRIFDENYGLREYDYTFLTHWVKVQNFSRYKLTLKTKQKRAVVKRMMDMSKIEREMQQKYLDEHCVRNY